MHTHMCVSNVVMLCVCICVCGGVSITYMMLVVGWYMTTEDMVTVATLMGFVLP